MKVLKAGRFAIFILFQTIFEYKLEHLELFHINQRPSNIIYLTNNWFLLVAVSAEELKNMIEMSRCIKEGSTHTQGRWRLWESVLVRVSITPATYKRCLREHQPDHANRRGRVLRIKTISRKIAHWLGSLHENMQCTTTDLRIPMNLDLWNLYQIFSVLFLFVLCKCRLGMYNFHDHYNAKTVQWLTNVQCKGSCSIISIVILYYHMYYQIVLTFQIILVMFSFRITFLCLFVLRLNK